MGFIPRSSRVAGEGANLVKLDAAELAEAILAHPDDIETALASYEEVSFLRSEAAAAESASNLSISFRSDAPQGMLDLMALYSPQEGRETSRRHCSIDTEHPLQMRTPKLVM